MPLTTPLLRLSVHDREEIDRWLDAHGTPQQVALRSRIVLAAAQGRSDSAVARDLEINRKTVTLWRSRFAQEGMDSLWEVAPGVVHPEARGAGPAPLSAAEGPGDCARQLGAGCGP